jgi:arsenate reductase (thioredoxin)
MVHVGFDDPPRLTQHMTDEDDVLSVYRRVRDDIKSFVLKLDTYCKE